MEESERTRRAISEETDYFIERLLKAGSHIDRPLQWVFDEALKEFDRQKERYLSAGEGMPFKVGMYGGKFCPLHEGHYSVIERALSECDGLIVVLFINGEDEAKFERRWFTEPAFRYYQLCRARERYRKEHGLNDLPTMDIIMVDSSKFMKDGKEDWYREADWINEQCRFIDAVYSSEPEYDAFFKRAYPSATHVLVDPERKAVPISATKLREMDDYSEELMKWMV